MNAIIAILALVGGTTILARVGCLALWLLGYAEIEKEEKTDDNE